MRSLSKSKIVSSRQCEKKLWLEVHQKELAISSDSSQKNFDIGNEVGEISRAIYDPLDEGTLIDPFKSGFPAAFKKTQELLQGNKPIFEAAFSIDGGLVLADVLIPTETHNAWHMVEIKSSTRVKDYHLDDVAIQHYVARTSGLNLDSIAVGHIDNQWVYQGDEDYSGLIVEVDMTSHAIAMEGEVAQWFKRAQVIVNQPTEPNVGIGSHCNDPFECPFINYCSKDAPRAEFPVSWLPRIQKRALKQYIEENNVIEMADVPDELLNEKQLRVKSHTLTDSVYFDFESSNKILSEYDYPHYYLDFETINLAVPKWKGTRAYQQTPFQFSLHYCEHPSEDEKHREFLDLTGKNPSLSFAKALIKACDDIGPIFVYNIGFESSRIKELAERFSDLKESLMAIDARLVDLWPLAKEYFYHPSQQGSWSIKKVLPAMAPNFNYDDLEGVKDGGMAMDAFAKAIHPATTLEEKKEIENQLLKYCEMDTKAMVEILSYLLIGPIDDTLTRQEVINKHQFTVEEIRSYLLALDKDKKDYRNEFEKSAMVAGRIFDEDEERCLSIIYRVRGLSELVESSQLPGRLKAKGSPQLDKQHDLLRAIGQCSMLERGDNVEFDLNQILKIMSENTQ